MKIPASFFFLLVTINLIHAQRGNNWVFGGKAIINFNTTPPTTGVSAMMQIEGSSSISDQSGNLLFYSDGISVWNAQHQVMPNGTGLFGDISSTQSSMIVPFPADNKRYYVFTMGAVGSPNGLCYSVVNMDLDNGKGDVELKNVFLVGPSSEKVTSVNHCNGKDVWVMTGKRNSDQFYAYLVTAAGIQPPVISAIGVPASYFSIGYLKFSPDGKKLACANMASGLDLFDFDAATGLVTNRKKILSGITNSPYGIEFSPNSRNLYISNVVHLGGSAYRFDLSQYSQLEGSETTIVSTRFELDNVNFTNIPPGFAFFNALQLGPDEQIHVSKFGGLGIIKKPDRLSGSCEYLQQGIQLAAGTNTTFGLPDFNQSYFKGSFSYDISCNTTNVNFYYTQPTNSSFLQWDFGDPQSGINNTSEIDSPSHIFTSPGVYTVKLVIGLPCRNDTLIKTVKVDPVFVNLGVDIAVCNDSLLILDPHSGNNRTYLWQDNSTNSILTAAGSGLYWVEVTNPDNGCKVRDSILLTRKPNPIILLGNDTTICERTSLLLTAGNPGANYTWQDNSTHPDFLVRAEGTYFVTANLNGCIATDTIVVKTKNIPRVFLGNDTAICSGMTMLLTPFLNHAENATFSWSTGDSGPAISVTLPGYYSLSVSNICGIAADGIVVKPGVCRLYVPTGFTPNNDGKNDIFKPGYGENVTAYSLEINNRWGEKIFVSKQLQNGWDGRYKGTLQPIGIYTWVIRYKVHNDANEYLLKGTVALIY